LKIIENLHNELLTDTELLEFLLHSANPHRNTLRMSHELVERFGSFISVVKSDDYMILSVEGINIDDILLFRKFREIFDKSNK
jgi:DNA repair protein RadC